MNIRWLKKGDLILIFGIALITGLILFWNTILASSNNDQLMAVITQDGKEIKKIDLSVVKDPEYVYINSGTKQVICAEKDRIRFLASECPDRICVRTGWLTKAGHKAVCVPSKTVITIVGESKPVDSISH
ncbi:MAG: NusG domain II-containing protein [Syntrophomonadaceae bacterium]|nr:NusG domain II-containing protein [Syntrophomonadaceae bacterium]